MAKRDVCHEIYTLTFGESRVIFGCGTRDSPLWADESFCPRIDASANLMIAWHCGVETSNGYLCPLNLFRLAQLCAKRVIPAPR